VPPGTVPPETVSPDTRQRAGTRLRWWREVLYVLAFYGIYTAVRNTQGSAVVSARHAFNNAKHIIRWEQWLHIFHEQAIQQAFLGARRFIQFWNVYYGSAHFVVTAAALIWLFRRAPERMVREVDLAPLEHPREQRVDVPLEPILRQGPVAERAGRARDVGRRDAGFAQRILSHTGTVSHARARHRARRNAVRRRRERPSIRCPRVSPRIRAESA